MTRCIWMLIVLLLTVSFSTTALAEGVAQRKIPYMKDWPTLPSPYRTRDWTETARKVTLLTLDGQAEYPYFPVTSYFWQEEPLSGGAQGQQFGTQTYLRSTPAKPTYGEAVAQLSAVVTASLTEGLDARNLHGMDFVQMAQAYFSRTKDGRGFVSNNSPVTENAGSYWYTLYPTCLYFHLAALHPEDAALEGQMREIADTWLEALPQIAIWDAQGYYLGDRRLEEGNHDEPEGILGAAYVMLMAHERFGDGKYLDAAIALMQQAAERTKNPYYEILGSYAPYTAARLNAQENAGLPLARMLDWVFNDGSEASRAGWGVISSRWGDYDAYGLAGSLTDTQGYAFSMNTFVSAGMLAPVARYQPQYSLAMGQYLTAVASNSHMFFGDGLPAELQDDAAYVAQTGLTYLVYEGVRNHGKTTPYATGDAKVFAPNVEGTNFSFYSSGAIGLFSSLISQTNVPEILCFDLLKTDFEHDAAYPTYLLYNPLTEAREVCLPLPDGEAHDVYDVVSGQYLGRNVCGSVIFPMAADTAVQAVLLPCGAALQETDGRLEANGVVVRYAVAWADMPGVEEYAVLREGAVLPLEVCLPEGDRVTGVRVTMNGREIASAASQEEPLTLTLPEGASFEGPLNITVTTLQGRVLGCSGSVKVLPQGMTEILHLTGKELKKAFPRNGSCRVYDDEKGIRLKITEGTATFRQKMMPLRADHNALLLVKVDQASASWGVQLYINMIAEARTIKPNILRSGEFLFSLSDVLKAEGLEDSYVNLIFTVSADSGQELVLEHVTVLAEQ